MSKPARAMVRQSWEIERDREVCMAKLHEVSKIRAFVATACIPSFLIRKDGTIEPIYPPGVAEQLAELDEMAATIVREFEEASQ